MTKETINQKLNGNKEGLWITYYANGNKRSEGSFKAGIKHGEWILYHQNGNKQSEATFVNGLYTGYYVSYHENGRKFREGNYNQYQGNSADGRKEGVWYQYEADGKTVNAQITYKRGRVIERINFST
jgi:antitoxin component YwqK of YwqJK toxin-antitoxin module